MLIVVVIAVGIIFTVAAIACCIFAHVSYDGRRLLWGLLIITQIIGLVTEIMACLDSHCADFPSSYEVVDV